MSDDDVTSNESWCLKSDPQDKMKLNLIKYVQAEDLHRAAGKYEIISGPNKTAAFFALVPPKPKENTGQVLTFNSSKFNLSVGDEDFLLCVDYNRWKNNSANFLSCRNFGSFGSAGSVNDVSSIGGIGSMGSVSDVGSIGSIGIIGSVGSVSDVGSIGSIGSVGSVSDIRSIGSIGSVGTVSDVSSISDVSSMGSVSGIGTIGSIGSVGSVRDVSSIGSIGSVGSVGDVGSVSIVSSVGDNCNVLTASIINVGKISTSELKLEIEVRTSADVISLYSLTCSAIYGVDRDGLHYEVPFKVELSTQLPNTQWFAVAVAFSILLTGGFICIRRIFKVSNIGWSLHH